MAVRKIIVGCDEGRHTRDAIRFASLLARVEHAELLLAHVYRHERFEALRLLGDVELTVPYGTRASLRAVQARAPEHGLHELADAEGADLIVVGERQDHRGQSMFVTGSHCAVAVAPLGFADDPDPALRVIGVGYDGSPESHAAVAVATELAEAAGATLRLIGIAEPPPKPTVGMTAVYLPELGDYRGALHAELERVAEDLPASLRTQVVLGDGEPAAQLIERADLLSLLVLGSRGYGPLRRALLGSVSAPVLRALPCPVLVVPRGTSEAHQAAA